MKERFDQFWPHCDCTEPAPLLLIKWPMLLSTNIEVTKKRFLSESGPDRIQSSVVNE